MDLDVTSLHHRRATRRWERMSVGDLIERVTWSRPDKPAIVGRPGAYADERFATLTYRQADEVANQVAHALLARGLARGDVVLLFCENSVEAYLTKIGIAKAGLVAAPLNPMMAPDLVAAMIDLVQPKLAILDAELWPKAQQPFAAKDLQPAVTIAVGGRPAPGSVSFTEFIAGQPTHEPDVEIHADDIWEILFTSGTTALPKGVMISHACSYSAGFGFALSLTRGLRLESDLKVGTYLPMIYHVGDQPFTYSVFLCGGTLVLGRKPNPEHIAEMIDAEQVTALWAGSPAMVRAVDAVLTARPELDAHRLTVVVYGWAALPPATLASMKRHCGQDLCAFEIFGQTESISCHRFWPDEWPELYAATAPQDNYVGVPSPILASTVLDPDGVDLASQPGVAGEAVYRSPAVMAGYYRDEAATRHAFRYGWFHSGDSCAYDEAGLRIMVDRYKDIVKTGGENVSSLRVEAVLAQHPDVAKAAVIGLPHPRWSEAVTAVVVLRPGAQVSEDELVKHCRAHLAGYETPKSVVFAGDLPETVGGKVLKYKLRAEHTAHYATELPMLGRNMRLPMKARHLPQRIAAGAFILNSGVGKWSADEETAAQLHGFAVGAYPFLAKLKPKDFVRLLSASEIALGAALLLPVVPAVVAGAGLTAFSGGLLGLYARTPGMRKDGTPFPTQQGIPLAKDAWMFGIGLGLVIDDLTD